MGQGPGPYIGRNPIGYGDDYDKNPHQPFPPKGHI